MATIQNTEMKMFAVEARCDSCPDGVMLFVKEIPGPTIHPKWRAWLKFLFTRAEYLHRCSHCGAEEALGSVYPYQSFVRAEG